MEKDDKNTRTHTETHINLLVLIYAVKSMTFLTGG